MAGETRFLVNSAMLTVYVGAGLFAWMLAASMAPAADAFKPLVINLSTIEPGERKFVRGQQQYLFIVHRTPEEIADVRADDEVPMPSPQPDAERVKRPEWLVVEAKPENSFFQTDRYGKEWRGKYGGWFAHWGDQHYDLSGRLREGRRATRNLLVPDYYFLDDRIIVIE